MKRFAHGRTAKRPAASRRGRAVAAAAGVLILCAAAAVAFPGCDRAGSPGGAPGDGGAGGAAGRATGGGTVFRDVTASAGLPAAATNWPDGTFATPEVAAGGVALLDYDGDGRLDIYQVCHGPPRRFDDPTPSRLFHQEPDGTFREVPGAGGAVNLAYGIGAAVGDYNNDGRPDIYVTNYGQNHLYRNNGDGSFTDV